MISTKADYTDMETIRLVQLVHPDLGRRVALVNEPHLILLDDVFGSVFALANEAINRKRPFSEFVGAVPTAESIDYEAVYHGASTWKLLPPLDHPDNPHACLVSGTGLTHRSSALNRQSMHIKDADNLTDSMKMYRWGLEGGKPLPGATGVQPEWFYKGTGAILRAHGQPLDIPPYADDGGEEAEIAGLYIVDDTGRPVRLGFCNGNEFSDHVMERKNYLYLAPSKLRHCAIGPELTVSADFTAFTGYVKIKRNNQEIWHHPIKSGEQHMAHSLANLEHHHFKYDSHRVPGQVHVHFFGADAFSFGNQLYLEHGDSCEISWENLGRPLINPVHSQQEKEHAVSVPSIDELK